MRAHANCVENLTVYAAIVIASIATGAVGPVLDGLAIVLIIARIFQTLIHVVATETNVTIAARFTFFLVQIVCMVAMIAIVTATAL